MKKILILLLAILLFITPSTYAKEALSKNSSINIDQKEMAIPCYNIDGYNYFKLRDLAMAMSNSNCPFNVDFNQNTMSVLIQKGLKYQGPYEDYLYFQKNAIAQRSEQIIKIDNIPVDIDAYLINGYNYFKLRDLGNAIGFYVGYDENNRQIIIDSNRQPTKVEPVNEPKSQSSTSKVDFVEGFYLFNSSKGATVSLPKGILLTFKNDILQSIKVVDGPVTIPKEGFCFYQRTDNVEQYKDQYIVKAPVGILLTMPLSIKEWDSSIRSSQVYGFTFMGNNDRYPQASIDQKRLFKMVDENKLSIYQGNSHLIFKEIQKGRKIGNLYWNIAQFHGLEEQKEAMIAYATSLLGRPYSDLDCSGLVSTSMYAAGMGQYPFLYTWTIDDYDLFEIIPMSQLKRGDILSKSGEHGHMMIYLGDGKVIESLPKYGVTIRNVRKNGYKVYRIKEM